MNHHKKTLCLDFDGVLHSYVSGYQGSLAIASDGPVDGAIDFITRAVEVFDVCIYSTRSESYAGILTMQNWLLDHGLSREVLELVRFPTSKPPAFVTIDDRAIRFTGKFPSLDRLAEFQPWNKVSSRPSVVCLCGSTRFKEAFQDANLRETLAGRIVLSVGCYMHSDTEIGITESQKEKLDVLHKHKIDLCDEVLVLNVGGYIGSSTRSEIEYATQHGKPIRYLEPQPITR